MTQEDRNDRGDLDEGTADPAVDVTLGGYLAHHDRPPAFEGADGSPYTVSMEVEKTPNLAAPFSGYLVFPRWAETGVGIVGHLETPLLVHGRSEDDVLTELGALPLVEVNRLLAEAIESRRQRRDDA